MMPVLKGFILFSSEKTSFSHPVEGFAFYLKARSKGLFVVIGVSLMLELAGPSDVN